MCYWKTVASQWRERNSLGASRLLPFSWRVRQPTGREDWTVEGFLRESRERKEARAESLWWVGERLGRLQTHEWSDTGMTKAASQHVPTAVTAQSRLASICHTTKHKSLCYSCWVPENSSGGGRTGDFSPEAIGLLLSTTQLHTGCHLTRPTVFLLSPSPSHSSNRLQGKLPVGWPSVVSVTGGKDHSLFPVPQLHPLDCGDLRP